MQDKYGNSAGSSQPCAPTGPPGKGGERYGSLGLLPSSADRGWSGLSAELRNHSKGIVAWRGAQSDTEICVDLIGNESLVTRRAAGIEDRRVAPRGTIWLSPRASREGSLEIAGDLAGILHIYLPPSQFSPSHFGANIHEPRTNAPGLRTLIRRLTAAAAHDVSSQSN